jgi:hypothetical protein
MARLRRRHRSIPRSKARRRGTRALGPRGGRRRERIGPQSPGRTQGLAGSVPGPPPAATRASGSRGATPIRRACGRPMSSSATSSETGAGARARRGRRWRIHWRTRGKVPANGTFLGGLGNGHPSLGREKVVSRPAWSDRDRSLARLISRVGRPRGGDRRAP